MGSKGVTDKERQKVFEAVGNGERMTEATVRTLVKGNKKKANRSYQKSESEKIKSLKKKIETYKKVISNLQDENKKLSKLLSNREKIESLV
jgi:cell shape-determining protein MreC